MLPDLMNFEQISFDTTTDIEIDLDPGEGVGYWFDWVSGEETDLIVDAADLSGDFVNIFVSNHAPTILSSPR